MNIKKTSSKPVISSINKHVNQLEELKNVIQKYEDDANRIIEQIRSGFQDVVIVFIDLVDSTRFKLQYRDEPEQWILRLMQFSKFLSELIVNSNGIVVKYIGDEVMAVFNQDSKVNDALNLVNRLDEIQEGLTKITGHETKVKIAIDKGNVYLVEYEGHNELDPQGTPVDRCARIAKFAKPGTVLTSFEYQKYIGKKVLTYEVGVADLKGLGRTTIYQLYEHTVNVEELVEIPRVEYENLQKENDTLQAENSELVIMNRNLQDDLRKLGEEPSTGNAILPDEELSDTGMEWGRDVQPKISNLKGIINKAEVPRAEYARFLFLYFKDKAGQKYNSYEGRVFDALIESNLVISPEDNGYFILNIANKLNKMALKAMDELEDKLLSWAEEYPEDEDFEFYDCTLTEPKFWKEYLDIHVL